jgi:hypothetical protein
VRMHVAYAALRFTHLPCAWAWVHAPAMCLGLGSRTRHVPGPGFTHPPCAGTCSLCYVSHGSRHTSLPLRTTTCIQRDLLIVTLVRLR